VQVALTDYPSPPLLQTLRLNACRNISDPLLSNIKVEAHLWGDTASDFAKNHGHNYDRVLAADTLWLTSQHENLAKSMSHFLARNSKARVMIVAGFHTGRPKVAHFFEIVPNFGLVVDQIWEMDSDGTRREWDPQREGVIGEGKRWMVLAVLKWAKDRLDPQ
jgi:Lysine methyltransferase